MALQSLERDWCHAQGWNAMQPDVKWLHSDAGVFFKANCMTDMPVSGCLKRGVRLCSGQEISDENIQREKSKCQALLLAAMCWESRHSFQGHANRNFKRWEKSSHIANVQTIWNIESPQDVWTLLYKLEDASKKYEHVRKRWEMNMVVYVVCPLQDLQASLLVPRRERFPAGEPLEVTISQPIFCPRYHLIPHLQDFAGTLNWFKLFWYSSLWGFSLVIFSDYIQPKWYYSAGLV